MARTEEQFDRFIERTQADLARLIRKAPPLDMSKAALLVIDMQNQFAHPDGEIYLNESRHLVKRIVRLCNLFREQQRPVIYTRHQHAADNSDLGMMDTWWSGSHIFAGSWNSEIIEKLTPQATDIMISKNRYSAFLGTNLEQMLKEHAVSELVITGVMTNLCCETTAREAFMRDYAVYFCLDGTTTISEEMARGTIQNLAYGFAYIVTAAQILAQFTQD
ncbi:MAG: isochorismatase family protein [bacterium]